VWTSIVDQHLGARPEGVRADGENRVFALLVLAQLGAQPGQQHAEAERLGDVVVGAGVQAEDRVGIGLRRRQHDDRRFDAAAPHQAADLAAVHVRQPDVEQDGVEILALGQVEGLGPVVRLDGGELLVELQLLAQGLAQRVVVIHQEDFLALGAVHGPQSAPPSMLSPRPAAHDLPPGTRRRPAARAPQITSHPQRFKTSARPPALDAARANRHH
jgi:hypothetical protein